MLHIIMNINVIEHELKADGVLPIKENTCYIWLLNNSPWVSLVIYLQIGYGPVEKVHILI